MVNSVMNFYFGDKVISTYVCINTINDFVEITVPNYIQKDLVCNWIKSFCKEFEITEKNTYKTKFYDGILSACYYNYYYYIE